MPRNTENPKPTHSEMNIRAVIWEKGSATVREVYDDLRARHEIGYTTVLKLMQIMVEKGLLKRDTSVRPQVFRPARPRKQTQKQMLGDLLDRTFGGSPGSLVLQALSMKKSTPEELQDIRDLLDRLEEGK